jgi:hypothetical protein
MIKKVQKNLKSAGSQIGESAKTGQQQDKQTEKENKYFGSAVKSSEF